MWRKGWETPGLAMSGTDTISCQVDKGRNYDSELFSQKLTRIEQLRQRSGAIMAGYHLLILLLSLAVLTCIIAAEHTTQVQNDTYGHVIIGPVENITSYFNGSTSIFLAWQHPPVYMIHDVVSEYLDQVADDGEELVVSKHKNSGTVEQGPATVSKSVNSSNSSGDTVGLAENKAGENETSKATVPETILSPSTAWTCHPISFFQNYTVELKTDPNSTDDDPQAVRFNESMHELELYRISPGDNQERVPFSQGCLTSYEIKWQDASSGAKDIVHNKTVPPTSRTFNITGLNPATSYKVIITAVYVSGAKIDSKPPTYFTTEKPNEQACTCDLYGTISPFLGCGVNGSHFCICKPGYQGDFCEMCAPGYYRTAAYFPCHRCPCERHATMTNTCGFVEGFLRCDRCEKGYAGNLCHDCDSGYYRYKRHCVPCFCNGNSSPDRYSAMCMSTTGMCINCQHNTTGFNCERCLPDYIGSATIYKNCTKKSDVLNKSYNITSSVTTSVVTGVIVTFFLISIVVVGVLLLRRYYSKGRRRAFWTVEMKRENDDVDVSSVHNDDVRLGDGQGGIASFFSGHGSSSSTSKYSKLQEEI